MPVESVALDAVFVIVADQWL